MNAWIRDLWDACRFKTDVYERLAVRRDSVLRGFLLIVVVALLAGIPGFVIQLGRGLNPAAAESELAAARQGLRQALDTAAPYLEQAGVTGSAQQVILDQIMQNMESGFKIAADIEALPRPLPRFMGATLEAIGAWASQPFGNASFPLSAAVLATWLGYGVWVMLAARLFHGKGELTGFFGTTALFAAPHVLDVLRWIPYVGGVIGFAAFAWGLAIYVKATAVSHKISVERAVVAVLLPAVVAALLLLLFVMGIVVLIAASAAGGGR